MKNSAYQNTRQPEGMDEVRGRLVDSILLAFAVMGLPVIFIAMAHGYSAHWSPDPFIQLAVYLVVLVAYLLRGRLPLRARFLMLLAGLYAGGIIGQVVWGFMGPGIFLLLFFVLLAVLVQGTRAGLVALGLSTGTYALSFAGFSAGLFPLHAEYWGYLQSPWVWALGAMAILFMGGIIVVAMGRYYGFLMQNVDEAHRRGDELETAVAERTGELRHANERLRMSEERLGAIFDASTDGIIIADHETRRFTYANRSAGVMLGRTPEQVTALSVSDIHPPEDLPYVIDQFEKQARREIVTAMNCPVLRADGTVFYADINTSPFVIDGRAHMLGLFRDVTERRALEASLLESEHRYRMVSEMTSDYIFHVTVGSDGSIAMDFTTDNFAVITGRRPDQVATPDQWTDTIHQEDLPKVLAALGAIIAHGGTVDMECRSFVRGGFMRWIQVMANAETDTGGRVTGILGAVKDITERIDARDIIKHKNEELEAANEELQATNEELESTIEEVTRANEELAAANRHVEESETRYRAIVESNPLGMHLYRLEPDGRLVFTGANPAADRILGVTNAQFVGKTIEEAFPPLADTPVPGAYREVIRSGEPWHDQQVNYRDKQIIGAFEVIAFRVSAGRLAVAFQDVTVRLQNEEMIRGSLAEKEILLKEVHHRVKNNMQIISSLLSLQMSGITDPYYRDLYQDSQKRIRAMALVHEKLYQSESLSQIDFKEYIGSLADDLARSSLDEHRPVTIICKIPVMRLDIDRTIPCGLLVNEIITNALKHAFPDGRAGTVTVSLTRNEATDYVLSVSDDGVGLPVDIDVRRARTLGMQLITTLTTQLRGSLSIEGDGGTRITVTFPA